jgi:hypothetical protein
MKENFYTMMTAKIIPLKQKNGSLKFLLLQILLGVFSVIGETASTHFYNKTGNSSLGINYTVLFYICLVMTVLFILSFLVVAWIGLWRIAEEKRKNGASERDIAETFDL